MRAPAICTVLLLCPACSRSNRAPLFMTFMGEPVVQELFDDPYVDRGFTFSPGETVDIDIEVRDPEGQDVELWFPQAPPGLSFEPEARKGTWNVPEDFPAAWWTLVIIAQDSGDPSGASTLRVDWLSRDTTEDTGDVGL